MQWFVAEIASSALQIGRRFSSSHGLGPKGRFLVVGDPMKGVRAQGFGLPTSVSDARLSQSEG